MGEQTLLEYCQLHSSEVWPDTLWCRDDPLPNSKSNQVRIRLEPELFHDLVLMESDSSRREMKEAGRFHHGPALGEQLQNLSLPWRQLLVVIMSRITYKSIEQLLGDFRSYVGFPL